MVSKQLNEKCQFNIDLDKYRIIDLSLGVSSPGTADRPFKAELGYLGDGSFKHDVSTHTHVGTHLESPSHFFEGGRRLEKITRKEFFVMALPVKFEGLDSVWTRAIAIEEK